MKSVDIDFVDICIKCENPITIIPGKRIISCNHCAPKALTWNYFLMLFYYIYIIRKMKIFVILLDIFRLSLHNKLKMVVPPKVGRKNNGCRMLSNMPKVGNSAFLQIILSFRD